MIERMMSWNEALNMLRDRPTKLSAGKGCPPIIVLRRSRPLSTSFERWHPSQTVPATPAGALSGGSTTVEQMFVMPGPEASVSHVSKSGGRS